MGDSIQIAAIRARLRLPGAIVDQDPSRTARDCARLLEVVDALAARVRELEQLLRSVMPEEMGGYPDLFYPDGGWEQFQRDAEALLARGPHGT